MSLNRRHFLTSAATLAGALTVPDLVWAQAGKPAKSFPIACNSYSWVTFYGRQHKNWMDDPMPP